jgi:hypothetical protein
MPSKKKKKKKTVQSTPNLKVGSTAINLSINTVTSLNSGSDLNLFELHHFRLHKGESTVKIEAE